MTQNRSTEVQAPIAKRTPKQHSAHGVEWTDDYHWLREKESAEVVAYLEAENAYTDTVLAPAEELRGALYREMLARIKETDESVPYPRDGFFYYSRTEEGKQYAIHARKRGSLDAEEEITLDVNALAEGKPFMAIGTYAPSDDGNLLAYTVDETGFRVYELLVKDLRTGEVLPDRVGAVSYAFWASDGKTLFYVREDSAKRPCRLFRHTLGEDAASDVLVYEEPDALFRVAAWRSLSRGYVFVGSASFTTSEFGMIPADRPHEEARLIAPRRAGVEYYPDHRGDLLYIRTNDTGRNFRLVTAPVENPSADVWEEMLPHRDAVMLRDVTLFANHMVASEFEGGLPQIRIHDLRDGGSHPLEFPEPTYSAALGTNAEFDTKTLRFDYQSLVTPASVYDYDMDSRERTLKKQQPVLGGFDPANYRSERIVATAADGVEVHISIVYRKDFERDGSRPLLLGAYGAYGHALPVSFQSTRLSLIDRGVSYAIAHVRGGSDMGKPWHDAGRMMQKKNTFTDFVACAEHLVKEGYTSSDRLAITGGSAGGLLMGAVVNMRPDLFRVVVSYVPFVDVINTMLDATLPLTVGEYEEWGNPNEEEAFHYMRSYSPYDNVEAKDYPAMLVKTSFNDSQVMYWEPAKYIAKLRSLKTDGNVLLLKTNMAAGHGGASGRYDHLREVAFDYAFILTQLGIE